MSFGQGGPQWGPGGSSTPDWEALAEDAAAQGRRKRWLMIGGGALATAVVAGVVAFAVVGESGGQGTSDKASSLPSPEDLPTSPSQPQPTFNNDTPPPPAPEEFLQDAKRDKAPLSVDSLFPDGKVTVNGRSYAKKATDTSKKCADAAHSQLGPDLTKNDCNQVLRATFTRGGQAVTTGVAVFQDTTPARTVQQHRKPNLQALPGKGVGEFCRTVVCRTTTDRLGRYTYFTISGHPSGKPAESNDKQAVQAAKDISQYTYQRVRQRGQDQAAAAVTGSPSAD